MSTKIYMLENLGCAHCAAKMEEKIGELSGITEATITFATKQLRVTAEEPDGLIPELTELPIYVMLLTAKFDKEAFL